MSSAGAAAGERLGQYRLLRPLGKEPSLRTFLAHDELLDRAVVVRFFAEAGTDGSPSTELRAALPARLAGAQALARLDHPHLQRVHRVSAGLASGERPYVVTEYVRGRKLESLPLPL